MRVDAANIRGKLWDLETGREILHPIWFDVEQGLFEAYQTNAFGRIITRHGDKLTYLAKGRIRFVPHGSTEKRRRVLEIGKKCMRCTRDATWQVSDETPLPPLRQHGKCFGRARVTGIRYYCAWHYEAPRILDARGEVMETDHETGARPQWQS